MIPPLKLLSSVSEYQLYYEETYTKKPLLSFDGIPIFFAKYRFSHAFYESSDRRGAKDIFSLQRAERMDWIKYTIESDQSLLLKGWDAVTRQYFSNRRVSILYEDFVVVIILTLNKEGQLKGSFLTCYQADNSIEKIKSSPIWVKDECIEELIRC
ncbi:MAG: hypothetical protein PHE60_05715 [Sulfurospirillaceae bacterium]|nr:hypothetical protein [Sulfurospirillaceae bacterium]